jgi:hypothetical protein
MINRRFMIVPPALLKAAMLTSLKNKHGNFYACSLNRRT